jgi:hypothetical protein
LFITNTFGLHAVGSDVPGQQFRDPGFGLMPFENANDFSFFSPTEFNLLSAGVVGNAITVPEPSPVLLLGLGATGLAGYWWRRRPGLSRATAPAASPGIPAGLPQFQQQRRGPR